MTTRKALRQRRLAYVASTLILLTTTYLTQPMAHTVNVVQQDPMWVSGIEVTGEQSDAELVALKKAGASWTRIAGIWWPDVELKEGQYNWAALHWIENLLVQAAWNRLRPVVIIRGTPDWAQQTPGVSCGPIRTDKLNAFADFVAVLVERYSQPPYNVAYWELGNEPDIDPKLVAPDSLWGCWGNEQDDYYGGGAYAEMLKAVYPRIKSIDSRAQVLVGGLALDCDPRPDGGCADDQKGKPPRFLEGILRDGGGDYFDGISYHAYDYYVGKLGYYSNGNFKSSMGETGPVSIAKAGFIRSMLAQYGVTGKFLIDSETALLCRNCDDNLAFEWTKAYYVAHSLASAMASGLSASIWFRLTDWPGTALLDEDMSEQPAYLAHQAAAARLSQATYTSVITVSDTGNSNVRGYKFLRAGAATWVMWSADAAAQPVRLPQAPRAVWDVMGRVVKQTNPVVVDLQPPDHLLAYVEFAPLP